MCALVPKQALNNAEIVYPEPTYIKAAERKGRDMETSATGLECESSPEVDADAKAVKVGKKGMCTCVLVLYVFVLKPQYFVSDTLLTIVFLNFC